MTCQVIKDQRGLATLWACCKCGSVHDQAHRRCGCGHPLCASVKLDADEDEATGDLLEDEPFCEVCKGPCQGH